MGDRSLPVNHALLKWAREEAGLSLSEAAERAKITPVKQRGETLGMNQAERLQAWESGASTPSLKQLESLAKAYRRSILTFFLASPPKKDTALTDFRTVADKAVTHESPEFSAFRRRAEWLQGGLKELVGQEGRKPLSFVGTVSLGTPVEEVAQHVRETINFTFEEQQALPDKDSLFRALRLKAQDIGIFILVEGDLGSSHSQISPEEFRGLAICDLIAPLIVINSYDSKAAQLFSLAHELIHIFIGKSGISNYDSFVPQVQRGQDIEGFCNAVAAEFLVPSALLLKSRHILDNDDKLSSIRSLSLIFKVSPMVVARRCKDVQLLSHAEYWGLFAALKKTWELHRARLRQSDGGPSRNILDRFRLGERTINTIINATSDGRLSLRDASRMLRVKVDRFDRII